MPTPSQDLEDLSLLGRAAQPSKKLEAFPNRSPGRFYKVTLTTDEFTCLCPLTKQPDFARITIEYAPDAKVVESKSLKLYFWSFRDEGVFREHLTNVMIDDLIAVLDPHWIKVTGDFSLRGGIGIKVESEHTKTPAAKEALR